jgi:hypothetical protein
LSPVLQCPSQPQSPAGDQAGVSSREALLFTSLLVPPPAPRGRLALGSPGSPSCLRVASLHRRPKSARFSTRCGEVMRRTTVRRSRPLCQPHFCNPGLGVYRRWAGDDIRRNQGKRMQVPSVAHPCLEIAETWRWNPGSLVLGRLGGLGRGM